MATATTADPEVNMEDEAAPPVRRKRWPLVIAVIALLAAIGGGAFWFLGQTHGDEHTEPAPEKEAPPLYVPLESFTVNLQPETGDQFLQVAMSLKVANEPAMDAVKSRMPEIRNRLLLLLSSKRASELISSEGKEKLSAEILDEVTHVINPDAPRSTAKPAPPAVAAAMPAATVPAATGSISAATATSVVAAVNAAAPAPAAPAIPAAPAGTAAPATAVTSSTPLAANAAPAVASAAPGPATPHATDAKPSAAPANSPISGVLFTSFIIQ